MPNLSIGPLHKFIASLHSQLLTVEYTVQLQSLTITTHSGTPRHLCSFYCHLPYLLQTQHQPRISRTLHNRRSRPPPTPRVPAYHRRPSKPCLLLPPRRLCQLPKLPTRSPLTKSRCCALTTCQKCFSENRTTGVTRGRGDGCELGLVPDGGVPTCDERGCGLVSRHQPKNE